MRKKNKNQDPSGFLNVFGWMALVIFGLAVLGLLSR